MGCRRRAAVAVCPAVPRVPFRGDQSRRGASDVRNTKFHAPAWIARARWHFDGRPSLRLVGDGRGRHRPQSMTVANGGSHEVSGTGSRLVPRLPCAPRASEPCANVQSQRPDRYVRVAHPRSEPPGESRPIAPSVRPASAAAAATRRSGPRGLAAPLESRRTTLRGPRAARETALEGTTERAPTVSPFSENPYLAAVPRSILSRDRRPPRPSAGSVPPPRRLSRRRSRVRVPSPPPLAFAVASRDGRRGLVIGCAPLSKSRPLEFGERDRVRCRCRYHRLESFGRANREAVELYTLGPPLGATYDTFSPIARPEREKKKK